MPNQEELERLDLNMLAIYCQRVAESPDSHTVDTDQARQLKAEWVLLIGHPKPPIPGLETPEGIEAYRNRLKQRMVSFLAGGSQSDAPLSLNAPSASDKAQQIAAGRGS